MSPQTAALGRRDTDSRGGADLARRFGDALRVADGAQAELVSREALAIGMSVPGVYTRVLAPAMHRIGELWEQRAITVADEHAATAITHRVMAALYSSLGVKHAATRETIVLAAPVGQYHDLGLRMAADVLEGAGFHVVYLGIDVPADALAAAVAEQMPALVCLSMTMPLGTANLETAIAGVADAAPDAQVLLGGQGVGRRLLDKGVPYAPDVESLVGIATELIREESRPFRTSVRPAPILRAMASSEREQGIGTLQDNMTQTVRDMADMLREQTRLVNKFQSLAFEDFLCGLPNRRAFDDRFDTLTATEASLPLTVMLLDLDGLKVVNDTHGHERGDEVLCLVADVLRREVRDGDFPARFGGDEFAILLPGADLAAAKAISDRIKRGVRTAWSDGALGMSTGAALHEGDKRLTLLHADEALYRAKEARARGVRRPRLAGSSTGSGPGSRSNHDVNREQGLGGTATPDGADLAAGTTAGRRGRSKVEVPNVGVET